MIPVIAFLAALGCCLLWAVVAGRASVAAARGWADVHIPLVTALFCASWGGALAWRSGAGPLGDATEAAMATVCLGLPLLTPVLAAGLALIGRHTGSAGVLRTLCWIAGCVVAVWLTVADRLTLLDGQLFVLAGWTIAWLLAAGRSRTSGADESPSTGGHTALIYLLAIGGGVALAAATGPGSSAMVRTASFALGAATLTVFMARPLAHGGDGAWRGLAVVLPLTMSLALGLTLFTRALVTGLAAWQSPDFGFSSIEMLAYVLAFETPTLDGLRLASGPAHAALVGPLAVALIGSDERARPWPRVAGIALSLVAFGWLVTTW